MAAISSIKVVFVGKRGRNLSTTDDFIDGVKLVKIFRVHWMTQKYEEEWSTSVRAPTFFARRAIVDSCAVGYLREDEEEIINDRSTTSLIDGVKF